MDQTDRAIEKDIALQSTGADYVTSAAKSALGMVPFAGSLLAEIAGNVIPNQRIDRIVKYAHALESRLVSLEQATLKQHVADDNFTDLVEESLRQAAKALTDERRDYISSLVANSISSEDLEHFESKHLLRILGELNDIEILWLRFYLDPTMDGDSEFRETHNHIFKSVSAHLGSSQPELDKSTLQDSYKAHLASLGLLEKETDMSTSNGRINFVPKDYQITSLGRLFLREVGFQHERLR